MLVTCPHCDYEVEIEDSEVEYMHKDGYIEDYECPECGEKFDIAVELVWTGDAIEIENEVCDECNKEIRTRNLHYRHRCSPFPWEPKYNKLCACCFQKVLYGEEDERTDFINAIDENTKIKIRQMYLPGLKMHVNLIKDPYRAKLMNNVTCTIDHVEKDCIVVCRVVNGDLYRLVPGYDDFYIKEVEHE